MRYDFEIRRIFFSYQFGLMLMKISGYGYIFLDVNITLIIMIFF